MTVKPTKNVEHKGKAMHLKDASKPNSEACHEDGMLKDATEITWLHSPSQGEPMTLGEKRR